MEAASQSAFEIKILDEDLPVLSTIATQAMSLIERGEASNQKLEQLIRQDPSLTSRILRLANSPLYGGKVKISSLGQAMVRLGLVQLKTAILVAATGAVFDQSIPAVREIWRHSTAVAITSMVLSEEFDCGEPDDAFVAGMLHDVGKLIIYMQVKEAYAALIDEARHSAQRVYRLERKHIGFTSHESVGGLVGRKWDLASEIVDVIRMHHEIEEEGEGLPLTCIVSLANLICNALDYGSDCIGESMVIESPLAEKIGLTEDRWQLLKARLPGLIAEQQASF